MISQLTGKIIEKQPPYLLLDVHGVGYSIACPMTTFYALPKDTTSTTLHTHLVVREDAWQLYGFCNRDERRLFRILIKISGVGPKLALTILSGMELSEFISCIRAGDHQRLVCIPGIGKKTAQRITVEARDAIDKWQCNQTTLLPKNRAASTPKDSAHQPFYEAQRALLALGYKDHETQQMIQKIKAEASDAGSTPKVEELIRQALKLLAQKA